MTPGENGQANSSYWNEFYNHPHSPSEPSQFCAFVASQFPRPGFVIDVGCGDGRDSAFFLNLDIPVLALDRSEVAIKGLKDKHHEAQLTAIFGDVTEAKLHSEIHDWLSNITPVGDGILYARFFLHAIDDSQEETFLRLLSELARRHGITICLEFRTLKDAERAKVTADHFRRYVDPQAFMARALTNRLKTTYFVEGIGFARMGVDDAHIARVFLSYDRPQTPK